MKKFTIAFTEKNGEIDIDTRREGFTLHEAIGLISLATTQLLDDDTLTQKTMEHIARMEAIRSKKQKK